MDEAKWIACPLGINAREKTYEGKYLIQTDQIEVTPAEAVSHYKDLNEVESGFRSLKDPLGMLPIWHHADRRVLTAIQTQRLPGRHLSL